MNLLEEDSTEDTHKVKEFIEKIPIEDENKVTYPEYGVTTNSRPSWLKLHMEQVHQKDTEITPDLKIKSESHPNTKHLKIAQTSKKI